MARNDADDLIEAAQAQITAILMHLDERLAPRGRRVRGVVFYQPDQGGMAVKVATADAAQRTDPQAA